MGETVSVVSPRHPAEHREALDKLLGDPGLRQKMRFEARSVAEELFGYARFVDKHRVFLHAMEADSHEMASVPA